MLNNYKIPIIIILDNLRKTFIILCYLSCLINIRYLRNLIYQKNLYRKRKVNIVIIL